MGHNDVPDGRDAMYEAFIDRVRDNIHIVLCMSPVGDNFRDRCRRFPALLNSCTVDWFSEWPAAALHSVSHLFVTRSNFDELQLTDTLADMFVDIHTRVSAASDRFYQVRGSEFFRAERLEQYYGTGTDAKESALDTCY
jgi:dynein heavy chain